MVDNWSPGDELLRWVSETGSGTWGKLRDAAAFVCRKHDIKWRPWLLANDLSAFGHIDIDWSTRDWSVAHPHLNLVPGMGLMLVLTGSRPFHVDRRFRDATDLLDVYVDVIPHRYSPMTKLAKCSSVEVAEQVAERLETELAVDPARDLVEAMRPVDEHTVEKAAAPSIEDATRFDTTQMNWGPAGKGEKPGLYRVDLHGRAVHRRRDEHGYWWSVDLAVGQFLELATDHKSVLRWIPAAAGRPPSLEVRQRVALPILAERAFRVCSGLGPSRKGGWKRYLNVPRDLAELASERLLQQLTIKWERD